MKKLLLLTICFLLFLQVCSAADFSWKCEDVSTATEGFFTTLEEPLITKEDPEKDPNNRLCFRKCYVKEGKRICDFVSLDQCKPVFDTDPKKIVTCERIQVIKSTSGTHLIYQYVGMIYKWAAGTIGIIAVFTLVYCGIGIMSAGGDTGKIDKYKQKIIQSLFGLVVLFLSGLILYTVNPTFFV